MRRFSVLHRDASHFRLIVVAGVISLLSVVFIRWTFDGSYAAQLSGKEITIYKTCYVQKGFVPDPECGIDEAATVAARAEQEAAEQVLQQRIDRNKTITPEQESQVQQVLEKRGIAAKQNKLVMLSGVISTALARIAALQKLAWNESDQAELERLHGRFQDHAQTLESANISRNQIRVLRNTVWSDTLSLQRVAARRPRGTGESQPVENIVTRIDALVASIGTVLTEIEQDGIEIPTQVRQGHERSKEAIRIAKRSCSMRRPRACAKLWDVLTAIESIRQPLCDLPSDRLTFCRR